MKNYGVGFAVAGSVMSMIFFMLVNYLTSPQYPWFIYPSMALLFWPISLYCVRKGKYKQLSYSYSTVIILFLMVENYIESPDYPWFLYGIFPILSWPILVSLGKRAKTMQVALIGSSSIIIYYIILNSVLSPQYPWVIYPAFVILWWPLTLYHARKKTYVAFSIYASVLIGVFFITVNSISSPDKIWAVYPIFCVLWWPLSMYYFVYKRS